MTTHPDYPGCSTLTDRHGTTRWRFRHAGRTVYLQGAPGDPEFDQSYAAAMTGNNPRRGDVVELSSHHRPGTLGAAWEKWKKREEWHTAAPATKNKNEYLAGQFLSGPVASGADLLWRDAPVADLRRRHIRVILGEHSDTPHKAKHILVVIRKMIAVALDEEWIEFDPTHKIGYRPKYKGWRAWTPDELKTFTRRWPIGSTPRLVFTIALWLGTRRSDLADLAWRDRITRKVNRRGETRIVRGFEFETDKTGKKLFIPESPPITAVLDAIDNRGETIILTAHGLPFSSKSLTGRMADWTKAAGLPKGCTLHGLRKTLGKRMAESEVTTRGSMTILGHDDIEHAELYSREAEAVLLAVDAMDKLIANFDDG